MSVLIDSDHYSKIKYKSKNSSNKKLLNSNSLPSNFYIKRSDSIKTIPKSVMMRKVNQNMNTSLFNEQSS
jgi:hypothetical protein